jgi:hypothetical protein
VRLGLCVNPEKVTATGISKRVVRSFGIGVEDLDEDEARIRAALKNEVLKSAKPYSDEAKPHLLPGIGPHPEALAEQQLQIDIPAANFGFLTAGLLSHPTKSRFSSPIKHMSRML